jgi:hypothetical protein
MIENAIDKASKVGTDFVVFGGMTMKRGNQQEHFLRVLRNNYPELLPEYTMIYQGNKWGEAIPDYYRSISQTFDTIATEYGMSKRLPAYLFNDILDENDLVTVILEQLDYLLRLKGAQSPYGYAGRSVSQLKQPISTLANMRQIKGVGVTTEGIIKEIIARHTCSYYEKLLRS